MERIFQQTYHIPGTLAANITPKAAMPCDCSLLHVSAVASNDSDARLKIGTSADDDACSWPIVSSATRAHRWKEGRSDFVGGQYPRLTDGTILVITLDYDAQQRYRRPKRDHRPDLCRRVNVFTMDWDAHPPVVGAHGVRPGKL